MTPEEKYRQDLQRAGFSEDPAQARAVDLTQRLYEQLARQPNVPKTTRMLDWFNRPVWVKRLPGVKGLYLWGGVGRGKTYVVDSFYECLNFEQKLRLHFHSFMHMIHSELRVLGEVRNPLDVVAERLSNRVRVICLDEFHVSDITDAMLLAGLLKALFYRGITLVTTSNEAPHQLYRNGLQRERFLPAIALLQEHTIVTKVDAGVDYRLRALEQAEIYHYPLDDKADSSLAESFARLTGNSGKENDVIEIDQGRFLETRSRADGVAWFDFGELCGKPVGPADYLELAKCYRTILLSNIPQFQEHDDDCAKRFITLVDTLYDRNVILICSAAVPQRDLYTGKLLARSFLRTISRLIEMATHDYLAREHLS